MNNEKTNYANCICGRNPNEDLIDELYPTKRNKQTGEITEWNFHCASHNGGCGRTVYSKSKETVIKRWENGETDEFV